MKSYKELSRLNSFRERFNYLSTGQKIQDRSFGGFRSLNQMLYRSAEWKRIRTQVILRDKGCDLGLDGFEIMYGLLIHHIEPITVEDLKSGSLLVFDLDNLITTTIDTHSMIHFGKLRMAENSERSIDDTKLW